MAKKNNPERPLGEEIIQKSLEDVMHESMMPYSEYVILERALPRVEDGLKPVQRRILYTMQELGTTPDKPHRKCARIVGDCLGKYHPHGDTSVYDALARMAQPFVMRGMLVDGHGNFGSIDGDSPAAMRYTEARMTPLALELLRDIDKDTVDFRLNFDDTQKEPDMLPGRYPNLLVNGASGIAVGLATNIPPHNLGEAIDAAILLIDKPNATTKELMAVLPGPDFPTGGILLGGEELVAAYETGRAKIQVRAKVEIEKGAAGRTLLVITEVPYQVNKAQMLEKILKLSEEKKALLSGIYDIRDESDRTGMRAVVELKRDVDPEKVLNVLYKYSDLQTTFGVNMVAIAGGKPVQMGIGAMLGHFIRHQKNVVTRRTQFDLEQAKARAHILEGLIIAVDNLDEVIRIIRASKAPKEAKARLMERFGLTDIQAQAILDMRLSRLTNLEILALRKEYEELQKLIAKLEAILKDERKLLKVIKDELAEIREKYADPRRTVIESAPQAPIVIEEEKPEAEDTVVLHTKAGFWKRVQPKLLEKTLSGGEALEPLNHRFDVKTDAKLLVFTDMGMCCQLPVSAIPDGKVKDRGLPLAGLLLGIEKGETVVGAMEAPQGDFMGSLFFVTRGGQIKRSAFAEYNVRKARFAAISLKGEDRLATLWKDAGAESVLLVTRSGMAICFAASDVPETGRATSGVRGIALSPGDQVLSGFPHDGAGEVLLATDRGCFKRCLLVDFDPQGRGGKGLKAITFQKNGANGQALAAAILVTDPKDFEVYLSNGDVAKINSEWVKIELRSGKGQPFVVAVLEDVVTDVRSVP